jgi:hypothetical protein
MTPDDGLRGLGLCFAILGTQKELAEAVTADNWKERCVLSIRLKRLEGELDALRREIEPTLVQSAHEESHGKQTVGS